MKKGLDKVKLVKGRARAIIAQPRPMQVIPDKKKNKSKRSLRCERMLDGEQFDDFLDDATHLVADHWAFVTRQPLTTEEKYTLNDVLSAFFAAKDPRA